MVWKSAFGSRETQLHTFLQQSALIIHKINLSCLQCFPIFLFSPLYLTIKKDFFINKWAPLWFIYNHKWTLNFIYTNISKNIGSEVW